MNQDHRLSRLFYAWGKREHTRISQQVKNIESVLTLN